MNSDVKTKLKSNVLLITYFVLLVGVLLKLDELKLSFNNLLKVLTPFIVGFVLAYLLKGMVNFFETKVFKFEKATWFKKSEKFKRPLAILCTYAIVIEVIVLLIIIVIPQLSESVMVLVNELPKHYETFKNYLVNFIQTIPFSQEFWMDLWLKVEDIGLVLVKEAGTVLSGMIPSIVDTTKAISNGVTSLLFGIIISIYMLSGKDTLQRQCTNLVTVLAPTKKISDFIIKVARMMNVTFSAFIVGQCVEAVILGVLCLIGMLILELPYTSLVSIIIGVSSIVPIFGAIFGTIPATFIVLMANPTEPMNAVWFVVMILVIQRIDNDLIYPRVIGNSVGLSGLWVIFALLVGGGLFGLVGMLVGIPLFAVVYQLMKEYTYKKIESNEK